MEEKNNFNSNIGFGTKNKKFVDITFLSDKKSAFAGTQGALDRGKGLELSYEQAKIKNEADVETEMEIVLGNKSSTSSLNILKTVSATASIPPSVTIKREIITMSGNGLFEKESSTQAPAYTPTPIKPAQTLNLQIGKENSDNNGNQALAEGNKGDKLIRLSIKDLSDEERKLIRAKRFNIIVSESSQNDNKTITKTVPNMVCEIASNPTNNSTPTYNILKKRAERFGENVSSVMKSLDYNTKMLKRKLKFLESLDQKEKMLKRKLKFLESVTNLKELELKKRRLDRFRMV